MTSLLPPVEKAKTKGKPSSKKKQSVDISTKRDPSYFEFVQSGQDSTSPTIRISAQKTKEGKQSFSRARSNTDRFKGYIDSFPVQIQDFIQCVVNVESDGHCGFRAIAGLLGMGEQQWPTIRYNLIGELQAYRIEYIQLFRSDVRVDELIHILSCFDDIAPPSHWMTLPDMGHVIASTYNVILVHLSRIQCLTYLPLRSVPPPQQNIITIGFVNNCHFVQVFLKPGSPIPPVACNWHRYRSLHACEWITPYISRIETFLYLVGKDVATQEVIDISD